MKARKRNRLAFDHGIVGVRYDPVVTPAIAVDGAWICLLVLNDVHRRIPCQVFSGKSYPVVLILWAIQPQVRCYR